MALNHLTAHQLLPMFASGETCAVEVTRAALDAIDRREPEINAFISVDADEALRQAQSVDDRRASGQPLGALAGIPVAIKDLICVRGSATTCGSRILDGYRPPYDATVIERLRQADAVLLGKTNMDEFAMGSSCETSHHGPTRNPANGERVPGGSSGGSAAAVAAHETVLALGSDTGGSVRQPAGYCGVVGLKPTYGRVSRYGLVAFASSLDQIGPVTKDVEDAALLLDAIAGKDDRDATSADVAKPDYVEKLNAGVRGLRIGLAPEYFGTGLDPEIQTAVETAARALESAGATIVTDISLPVAANPEYCVGAYYIVAMGEASANLARYDGVRYAFRAAGDPSASALPAGTAVRDLQEMYRLTRSAGFGEEVKRRIMLGTYVLSAGYYDAYYLKAQKVRTLISQDFERAYERCDYLLSPVAPTTAFRIGEQLDDPLQMYLNDIYTVSVNLAGLPGISVPVATSTEGLPIGAQLLAPPFAEAGLLQAARALEGLSAN